MSIWNVLEQVETIEVSMTKISDVNVHPFLQPRNDRLIPFRDQGRSEQRSQDHSQMLSSALEVSEGIQLEAIWLAQIPDTPEKGIREGLYVVDGHHRLDAYKKAKRLEIPARIQQLTFLSAVMASKPVNCGGCKLAMHKEQRLDAAWQYLAMIMDRGAKSYLPQDESLRRLGGRFGIGHNTVGRMIGAMQEIQLEKFPLASRDLGTNWPRWRYVREQKSIWLTQTEMLSDGERTKRNAENLARCIVKIMEGSNSEERALALQMLAAESSSTIDPSEAVSFLAAMTLPYETC